jgi:hypothetical protein
MVVSFNPLRTAYRSGHDGTIARKTLLFRAVLLAGCQKGVLPDVLRDGARAEASRYRRPLGGQAQTRRRGSSRTTPTESNGASICEGVVIKEYSLTSSLRYCQRRGNLDGRDRVDAREYELHANNRIKDGMDVSTYTARAPTGRGFFYRRI